MIRLFIRAVFVLSLGLLTLAAPALAQQPQPKDVLRATHGAWEVRCIEGTDTCAMQQIGSTGDGKRALLVTVQRLQGATLESGEAVPAQITVQAPLGILIGYGIRVKVDEGPTVPIPLTLCVPAGCVASAPMRDEAVNIMKRGSTAVFVFAMQNEVPVNISLNGFTNAFNSLTPVRPSN